MGQISIALVSKDPIDVYSKDETDNMIKIESLLEKKGVELKTNIIKGWFRLNQLKHGDSEAEYALEICKKGRIWFLYDLDNYHYDLESIFNQFLDFQKNFNCKLIGYINCRRDGEINENHYGPKFDGSKPPKCKKCGTRVHFPKGGPIHPQFINPYFN